MVVGVFPHVTRTHTALFFRPTSACLVELGVHRFNYEKTR